jgi:mRNA-degrading endonuclease toxin of MazEF toxin-antitoxin module
MQRIDFKKLRSVANRPGSDRVDVRNSKDCYPEYNALLSNYIVKHNSFKEKESALHIMSMQNWIDRKEKQKPSSGVAVDVGQIWLADLGNNYKPECAYPHPVIILELIGNMVFVVPCTTSSNIVSQAFHPIDNPSGNMFYRKVTVADGFKADGAAILSNVRAISQGRLLDYKGKLQNISDPTSLFAEIKNRCLEFCFPKQHIEHMKAKQRITELETKNQELEDEKAKLLERIKDLEEQLEHRKNKEEIEKK